MSGQDDITREKPGGLDGSAALVLLSGGQDSATSLAWALQEFQRVETIGFHYGQRHRIEMDCRDEIRQSLAAMDDVWRRRLGEDHVLHVPTFEQIGETAMTSDVKIAMGKDGLPTTFVPGRNLVFLSLAGSLAYRRGAKHLVTGVCETDYSGYPDCRDDTVKAMQVALNLGLASKLVIHTPLMWRDKAETWRLAETLGGATLVESLRTQTHTCYLGDRTKLHSWGYGCGDCPACELRRDGWSRYAGV